MEKTLSGIGWQTELNLAEAKPRFDAIRREAQNRKAIATLINRTFGG